MFRTISLTALLAGTLDISSAIVKYYIDKHGSMPLFKYIASAVFGQEAYAGGTLMVVWGLVFHYMIAFIFTVFLSLFIRNVHKFIRTNSSPASFMVSSYGLSMNRIVVPLSLVNQPVFNLKQAAIAAQFNDRAPDINDIAAIAACFEIEYGLIHEAQRHNDSIHDNPYEETINDAGDEFVSYELMHVRIIRKRNTVI